MLTIQHGKEILYEDTAISVRKQGLLHPHDHIKVNWDIFLGILYMSTSTTCPSRVSLVHTFSLYHILTSLFPLPYIIPLLTT